MYGLITQEKATPGTFNVDLYTACNNKQLINWTGTLYNAYIHFNRDYWAIITKDHNAIIILYENNLFCPGEKQA